MGDLNLNNIFLYGNKKITSKEEKNDVTDKNFFSDINKIDINDNKNIKSDENINIFSFVEKKIDENNTNDNNIFSYYNRNNEKNKNIDINNVFDKNVKNELYIINDYKKEKGNIIDNKKIKEIKKRRKFNFG